MNIFADKYFVPAYALQSTPSVIPRLDRGIQVFMIIYSGCRIKSGMTSYYNTYSEINKSQLYGFGIANKHYHAHRTWISMIN